MPHDDYTMVCWGPGYVNAPRVELGDRVERIIAGARDKEDQCREQWELDEAAAARDEGLSDDDMPPPA